MPHLSPPTLTRVEVEALLKATARHPRDHLIIAIALGTGLRLAEIVGLDVGDVYLPDGTPRVRVRLRAEIAKGRRAGDVFLPDALLPKLRRFWRHKAGRGESLEPAAPLLCSQSRWRISKRRVQVAFRIWQVKAGLGCVCGFHALRHTAVTNVYRMTRDLFLAQRFARHVSPLTTTIYTHVSVVPVPCTRSFRSPSEVGVGGGMGRGYGSEVGAVDAEVYMLGGCGPSRQG